MAGCAEGEGVKAGNFGKNLRQILDTLGLTQVEFAQLTGLTQASISQIINGEREPSLGTICKILSVVPIKFERLVT